MALKEISDILATSPNVFEPYLTSNRGYVTLDDYSDGTTDWTSAFTDAMTALKALGGGVLWVPCRSTPYSITSPVAIYSNCHIASNGAEVRNTASDDSGANYWKAAVFFMGTFSGFNSGASPFDLANTTATGSLAAGASTVTLTDATGFDVGSIIAIESIERVFTSYPASSCINTVIYKSGSTITLKYPLQAAMGSGGAPKVYLVPTDPDDSALDSASYSGKAYLAHNASITGLKFGPSNALTSTRYGQALHISGYECRIADCDIEGGGHAVGGNPFSHCLMDNCDIKAQDRGIEMAYLSHDSVIRDTNVNIRNAVMAVDTGGFSFAVRYGSEGGHDNALEGGTYSYTATGTGSALNQPAVGMTGPRSSVRGAQIFGGPKPSALATASEGCVVADNRVSGGATFGISVTGLSVVTGNIITGNRATASIKKNSNSAYSAVANNVLGDGSDASHVVA